MALNRKPFQGVKQIIQFNTRFYFWAIVGIIVLFLLKYFLNETLSYLALVLLFGIIYSLIVSIMASYYIYDNSDLYELNFLEDLNHKKVLSINAGLDEISELLVEKYPHINLSVVDFYNEEQHTEPSIKKARLLNPPKENTIPVHTDYLPFDQEEFDVIIAFLSVHEIRKLEERILFFKEINRTLKANGKVYVTEHLRDWTNAIVYTLGVFHFHTLKGWMQTFKQSMFSIINKIKTTPFITTFILQKT